MGSISMPYDLPREAIFLNSSMRPWVRATEMLPVRLKPSLDARLLGDSVVEVDAVAGDVDERPGVAQLGDEPGCVPGRAAGDVPALQQHNVLPAQLRQMVSRAATSHAAANDYRAGVGGEH